MQAVTFHRRWAATRTSLPAISCKRLGWPAWLLACPSTQSQRCSGAQHLSEEHLGHLMSVRQQGKTLFRRNMG